MGDTDVKALTFRFCDVIVIGAGAAGLMSAITAGRGGARVLLLEGQKKIGAKILMSGGTRCNVTNTKVTEKDYNSQQLLRARNILRGFDHARTLRFFKDLDVEMVLEPTGKYFPITNSGKTVLDALLAECQRLRIEIQTERKVVGLSFSDGKFSVRGQGFIYAAKNVVLTTGGLSYPTTGSDGTGFRLAQSFSHTILTTMPALTPLLTSDELMKKLSGISLPVGLSLYLKGKKARGVRDDFLFTHVGFSGPAALDISRHWLAAQEDAPRIFVNFLPAETVESFEALLDGARGKHPKKTVKVFLGDLLPERLVEVLLAKAGVVGGMVFNQLSRDARKKLTAVCAFYPLVITGVAGYSKAEVTAGGLDLSEVNAKTLESNFQPGLFFAGEIMDVDGRIGGFNFQWAWASGFAVGCAISQRLERNDDDQKNH